VFIYILQKEVTLILFAIRAWLVMGCSNTIVTGYPFWLLFGWPGSILHILHCYGALAFSGARISGNAI